MTLGGVANFWVGRMVPCVIGIIIGFLLVLAAYTAVYGRKRPAAGDNKRLKPCPFCGGGGADRRVRPGGEHTPR